MATKPGYIVLGKEVPLEFRKRIGKPKLFYKRVFKLFAALVGKKTVTEVAALKAEFPNEWEFINMLEGL